MNLPKLTLEPGYTEAHRSGTGYKDPLSLLKDLYAARRQLEETVDLVAHDEPARCPATIGFDLVQTLRGEFRWWEFFIEVPDLKVTFHLLSPAIQESFRTASGRAHIARLLHEGISPSQLGAKLEAGVMPLDGKARP